jgi:hypothetical protein
VLSSIAGILRKAMVRGPLVVARPLVSTMGCVEPVIRYDDPAGQLPTQCERSRRDTPEMCLCFIVLCQALEDAAGAPRDLAGCSPSSRRARASRLTTAARAWIASNANCPRSFSLVL